MGQIINTKNKIRPDYKWIVLTIFRHIPIFSNTLSSESCYFGANGSVLQTLLCDIYLGCSLPSNVKNETMHSMQIKRPDNVTFRN